MTKKTACVHLRFITLMQRYSGKRDMDLDLPTDPEAAIAAVIERFNIPWKDHLEKSARILTLFNRKTPQSARKLPQSARVLKKTCAFWSNCDESKGLPSVASCVGGSSRQAR